MLLFWKVAFCIDVHVSTASLQEVLDNCILSEINTSDTTNSTAIIDSFRHVTSEPQREKQLVSMATHTGLHKLQHKLVNFPPVLVQPSSTLIFTYLVSHLSPGGKRSYESMLSASPTAEHSYLQCLRHWGQGGPVQVSYPRTQWQKDPVWVGIELPTLADLPYLLNRTHLRT